MNDDWKFILDDPENASANDFDDCDWRTIRVPHDWSREFPFRKDLEGCTGYLPGGVGWYRKHLSLDLDEDQVAYLCFDGVYNRAEVWLNGRKLGFHPFGYSPFFFEICEAARAHEGDDLIGVRVDHARYADSRWYTGSGIYRDVSLLIADKLHVAQWGTCVTTPHVCAEVAEVDVATEVCNAYDSAREFLLQIEVVDPSGEVVATHESKERLAADSVGGFKSVLRVRSPQLWDISAPRLHTARSTIVVDGKTVDTRQTRFGIRSFRFDPDAGFFLNGERRLIKGVCLHHDGGLVGAAVPKGVWRRRLVALMDAGCNAVRTAHNPPSAEFLDLCDELGLLVQNEFYDEWDLPKDKRKNMQERSVDFITRGHHEFFQEWAERDLKATVRRDRNHPCIIQWSIGNEIEWTYPRYRPASGYFDANWKGNYFWTPPRLPPEQIRKRYESIPAERYVLADTARRLAGWTREMDPTRPVTANCILPSVSHVSGYADALDIVGYSYRRVVYDYAKQHFPRTVVMGTENLPQWHEWKAVRERPFVSGLFLWTGIDYLGEANQRWPQKGLSCGLLDTAGFDKPSYHMMKTLWRDEPHAYLVTQRLADSEYLVAENDPSRLKPEDPEAWKRRTWEWHDVNRHWNYQPGETIAVEVYTNAEHAELLLNDRSLGVRNLADFPDRILKWAAPFEAGELRVVTHSDGSNASDSLITSGPVAGIVLDADTAELRADGEAVAHITATLVDAKGTPVRNAEAEVRFEVEGPVAQLGVDNGSLTTVAQFQASAAPTHQGRCLTILQSTDREGTATVKAHAGSMQSNLVSIRIAAQ